MQRQIKQLDDDLFYWILDKVGDQAWERFPKARGYTGHMKKIAKEDFGVRLTDDIENASWGDTIYVVDEQRLLMARLKYS